jgi:hypothetical protein
MRREAILLIAVWLGGCLPDQTKANDLTACRIEADRFYQGYSAADAGNPRSKYIVDCMATKGYDFDVSAADCDSRRALVTQSACYAAQGWLARIVSWIRDR